VIGLFAFEIKPDRLKCFNGPPGNSPRSEENGFQYAGIIFLIQDGWAADDDFTSETVKQDKAY